MNTINLGKYRTIAVAIAMFLVLDLGVLGLNFVISSEIAKDAVNINLAGRQRMLSQRIAKASLQLKDRIAAASSQAPEPKEPGELTELAQAATIFDRTLAAFTQGGSTLSGTGSEIVIAALEDAEAQAILLDARTVWTPLAELIRDLARQAAPEAVEALARRAGQDNLKLLKLMNDLTTQVEALASAKASRLRMVQVTGISLATLNFIIIMFHFIGHLRRNDQKLERAQKETADILRTTQEGLFLLDPQYIIGSQHSRVLEGIIGTGEFSGKNFFALLQPMVTERTQATAREYLELLFKHDVKEKLVTDLNPLNCVQILYGQGTGKPETRYLEFGFNRVKEGKRITHLLVTVNDITQRVNLERSLKETEARTRDQIGMLIEILQIEPAALRQFLRTAREGLQNMNELLQRQETGLDARGSKVHALFRQSHRIKGDAAALGLKNIAAAFEHIEDTLTGMHERHHLTGEDFLPIAVQIKGLYEQIEAIETLIAQISQARGSITVEPPRQPDNPGATQLPFVQRWRNFANEIATRQGNIVEVDYDGIDIGTLPTVLHDAANTLVNQFIRNAVAHGIESPEARKRLNKPERGRMSIHISRREDGGIDLGFRDDGRGISVERVRQSAVAKGRLTAEEAAAWEPRRVIGLIFEPGMSTRQTVDGDAGRGAGLDTVREIVTRMGGNIRLGTTANEYCHFRINLAAAPNLTPEGAAA